MASVMAISACGTSATTGEKGKQEKLQAPEATKVVETTQESQKKEEKKDKKTETVKDEKVESMKPLLHAINTYLYSTKTSYHPEEDAQYWEIMSYVGSMCGPIYGEDLCVVENDKYRITSKVMEELAYAVFAERNQLKEVEIPKESKASIYYNKDWDAYYVKAGDAGDVHSNICTVKENKDKSKTVEVEYRRGEDDKLLSSYRYTLVTNEIEDMSIFPYAVKDVVIKKNESSQEEQSIEQEVESFVEQIKIVFSQKDIESVVNLIEETIEINGVSYTREKMKRADENTIITDALIHVLENAEYKKQEQGYMLGDQNYNIYFYYNEEIEGYRITTINN